MVCCQADLAASEIVQLLLLLLQARLESLSFIGTAGEDLLLLGISLEQLFNLCLKALRFQ